MGSGEAFATVDREGRFSYVNDQAERLLGRAGARTAGPADLELLPEDGAAAPGGAVPAQLCRRRGAGSRRTRRQRCRRRIEARGYPFGAGLAVHLRDVTARHKAQEQLRLLESSIARLNDIVIITEAGPFNAPGPRIVFVNEAFERRTGYSPEEVLGRTPRLLQGQGTQRSELDRIRAAMEQWQPARVDLINYKKNGEAVLGRPGGVAGLGRGAPAHALGRRGTRHHRAQDGRGKDPVPRVLRSADAAAQPAAAAGPPAAGAVRPRPSARRRADVHRPGQLQGAQRHAGPPEGRPAAAAGRRAPALLRAPRRHRGAAGRRRVRDPAGKQRPQAAGARQPRRGS